MSKQSEAKEKQGYTPKAIPQTCQNCNQFMADNVQTLPPTYWYPHGRWQDKNLRCLIGGFAVKKMGTCNQFTRKT